jgi:hypothetical protein
VTASASLPDPGLFPLPELSVARHPAVILAPRRLKRWIGELPLANPQRTADLLLQQLGLLVHDPQPGPKLSALLGLHAEPVAQLLAILLQRMRVDAENALPMDPRERQLVDILLTLGDGYLRTFNEALLVGRAPPAEDLYTAAWAFDQALGIERLRYRPAAQAQWQRLLKVFLCAEGHGLGDRTLPEERRREGEAATVRAIFFRALVIGLSDPHRQRPSEMLAWAAWLTEHGAALELSQQPRGSHPIPVDLGPRSAPPGARRVEPGPDTRYLLTDDLLRLATAGAPGLHVALLDLAEGRHQRDLRRSPRRSSARGYRILPGLRNISRRLDELSGAATGQTSSNAWDARQLDQSKRGAAFVVAAAIKPPLMIGAPILAEVAEPGQTAAVGFAALVRRVVSTDEGRFEIGVEKLQGRIVPVKVATVTGGRSYVDPHGLLLHPPGQEGLVLLAPRAWYRHDDLVAAEGPATRYRLRMTGLRAAAHNIALIDVEPDDS